jgi:hypothetical protein
MFIFGLCWFGFKAFNLEKDFIVIIAHGSEDVVGYLGSPALNLHFGIHFELWIDLVGYVVH